MATETKTAQAINADEIELKKFGELAHKWWDKNSEFKPLHEINPLRLDYIDSRADLKNKRVLDVGCGGGILSESMYFKGAAVTGIDLGEKALNVAKLHQYESGSKVDYRLVSVEQLASEQPASFDVVTCMEMLEHVPDPVSVVNACAKLVKPGGKVTELVPELAGGRFDRFDFNIRVRPVRVVFRWLWRELRDRSDHIRSHRDRRPR